MAYIQKRKCDIICLQETHLTETDRTNLVKEWNIEFFLGGESTNSKGVAILINNSFEYKIDKVEKDSSGRYMIISLLINNNIPLLIINLYGPNLDSPIWFANLFDKVNDYKMDHIIMVGDWNTSLTNLDTYNYNIQRNLKSRNIINNFITDQNFVDVWRLQNKDQKRFTWGTKKPYKRSRLDYFLISDNILAFTPKAEIKSAYKSDHNPIILKLNINKYPRGKGSWKFNNNLLTMSEYTDSIKNLINLAKHTYALPIYSEEYINKNNGESLEILIEDSLFLNTLLCQIRGETIKYSKRKARETHSMENNLIEEITKLEIIRDNNILEFNNDRLNTIKLELENLREDKLKGYQIRSRYQHTNEWEKPSKYFLNLEKKNYLNKNIAELKDDNDKIINNPEGILEIQACSYEKLFSTKHININNHTTYTHFLQNLPKLSVSVSDYLEEPITISEVEFSIINSKTNKAPGPDGFSNEFFKFFQNELKHWLLRVYFESQKKGSFSDSVIEGTITCIPKTGKERNLLQNWRPLTLLNSTYTFFSSIIAKRIKNTLEFIINPDQTGFISDRFIGENTRLLLDTLQYCEANSVRGLMVIVDYAKAFDTIEWPFIEFSLKKFGFGEFIINSVKLLQKDSFSRIEQNGFFSRKINLSRGCRQGDPISPYLFVICAELLSHVIRENKDVKGIKIGDTELKLSQYAHDTTLCLDEDRDSLICVMDILRWFNRISGLDINKDKTKVIKIGASRDRRITWEGKFGLKWTHKFKVLGIHYDTFKLHDITTININLKMAEIKNLIRVRSTRKLTPYGKVTIVKSLLLSKITHILLSLPSPENALFKEIENIFLTFVWCGKPAKFSRNILEAEIGDGGMKLHNIVLFDKSLKLGWLRRYLKTNGKWKIFLDLEDFQDIFNYGSDFIERMSEIIQIPFWNNVLCYLKDLLKSECCEDVSVTGLTPIWYNPILRIPLKYQWLQKGISIIGDVLSEHNEFISLEDFQLKFGLKTNFLEYGGFILTIKLYMDTKEKSEYNLIRPTNCLINTILSKDKKGVSNLYRCLHEKNGSIIAGICAKWMEKAE